MVRKRALLPDLRERVRRIERPTAAIHRVLPFGIAAIDRVLPGGGLARGALHEILGMGGDEEDGALAAAFAAGILGRLAAQESLAGNAMVLWCLPRPDLYGPGLAAHGLDPARPRAGPGTARRRDPVGDGGGAARPRHRRGGRRGRALAAVASRRLQLAAERSGVTAFLLRRWRDGGQAARERDLPNAAVTRWRIAALPSQPPRSEPGVGTAALAGRAVALPRRRAGMLGSGGGRCDGSCISVCRAGRSTGCACRRWKNSGAPAEEAPFATVADTAGRRLLAAVNPAAAAAGLAPGMPLADALSFLPGLATAPAEPAEDAAALPGWPNGAAATARGPLPTERTGCGSRSPARLICGAARGHLPPI